MPRKAWTLPDAVITALETEAARRLKSNETMMRQSRTLGSVSRDLVLACIVTAFGQVRHMTKEELEECLRRAKTLS